MHGLFVRNWWKGIRALQQANLMPELMGIIYIQGVQDSINQTASDNYYTKLVAYIPQLRAELGYTAAQSKLFICRAHTALTPGVSPYKATIRAAQEAAAVALPNAVLFSLDSYPLQGDEHLSGTANISIGNESPIRIGDDGLSSKLVRSSIQGAGNAVVPQVVFEIYKAIELTIKANPSEHH